MIIDPAPHGALMAAHEGGDGPQADQPFIVSIVRRWLTDVLSRIADHKITRLDELLPWRYAQH